MSAIVGYNTNTNGLSLYLDARNPTSYPGTGNTWFDLSVGANNVSTGSMTYVNAGLTSSFSSSYVTASINTSSIDFYAPNLTTVATVETVCRFNSWNWATNGSRIFGWNTYTTGFTPGNGFIYFGDGGGGFDVRLPTSGSSVNGSYSIFGIWYYFVFEMYTGTTGNGMLDNKMWINGVQQTLTSGGTPIIANQNFNGGNGAIAKNKALSPGFSNECGINSYSMFKVYNRTLSQEEITNNYNYYKPIFNLY
jgi:hypothetical protein